ncbi:MAG: ATP-binding protein [Pseudomonadota bacterium]
MGKSSLFSKFKTLVVSLIMLAALSVGVGLSFIGKAAFLRTIQSDYRMVAAQAGRHTGLYLGTAFQEIRAAAAMLSAVRLDSWRHRMALAEFRRNFSQFQEIGLVYSNDGGPDGRLVPAPPEYHQVVSGALSGLVVGSSVTLRDGLPVLYLAAPVFYDGRPEAALWARLDLKPVWDLVIQIKKDLNLGPEGHVYLTDSRRKLVAGDVISGRFGQVFHLAPPTEAPATAPPAGSRLGVEPGESYEYEKMSTPANLLRDRELRPDFWIGRGGGVKMIFLRAKVTPLDWTFYMTQPYKDAFQFLYDGLWTAFGLMSAVILVGVIVTRISTRRVLAPIARLHQGVARAAQGDFSEPIAVSSQDEVGDLANHFNDMQASLHDYVQRLVAAMTDLNHANCLAVLGTTSSQINHQVGNFLNYLMVTFSILKADRLSEDSRNSLQIIEEQTLEIKTFMERLGRFANKADLRLEKWIAQEELKKIIGSCETRAKSMLIDLNLITDGSGAVLADKVLLKQAFLNIIENAFEAAGPRGRVAARVEMDGERVRIQIQDNGRGIPAEDLDTIFTPFFSTKKGKGVGLGLALAQNVITAHRGEIIIESVVGKGTAATVWLPQAPPALPV